MAMSQCRRTAEAAPVGRDQPAGPDPLGRTLRTGHGGRRPVLVELDRIEPASRISTDAWLRANASWIGSIRSCELGSQGAGDTSTPSTTGWTDMAVRPISRPASVSV